MTLASHYWWIAAVFLLIAVLTATLPGRGPIGGRRDVWRRYRFVTRAIVMRRASAQCEAAAFIVWGRCPEKAVEVDHIYPYSKGGPTIVSNGQALCHAHNRRKAATMPPWWYVLGLERRRRKYFPPRTSVRVIALMTEQDQADRLNAALRPY